MSLDTRKKGCPNEECGKHKSKFFFEAEDNYCKECGSKLVFVCARCFKEIPDEGPEHKYCEECRDKQSEPTLLNKAKYVAKGLDYARVEALKKAQDVTKDIGSKIKEAGNNAKEANEDKDIVDTIIDTGTKAIIGVGTFAIKKFEHLTKGKADDEDTEE